MLRTILTIAALVVAGGTANAAEAPQGHRVEVNGMQMYYEVSGKGDPMIVLHGSFMTIPMMGKIVERLAETHQVYALELQGHGRTTDIDRPITYPNLAGDVATFMDAVGIEKADVFGYSLGAVAGLRLAIDHPEKVDQLIVAAGVYKFEGWQPAYRDFIPSMTVDMFTKSPLAEDYKAVAPDPNGFPALAEKLIALEKAPFDWSQGDGGGEDAGADHGRRRRRGDARARCRDVPPARRRRHGRHGQAALRLAARDPARHLAHRSDRPARPDDGIHRTVPGRRDAQGLVRLRSTSRIPTEANDMTATYTFDVFSSLDGYGAASGNWGGYWGKQGPELLDHRLALYEEEQRMVFGANTYRAFARMLASSTEDSDVRDPWVTRMRSLPATVVSTHAGRPPRLAGRDRRERRRRRRRRPAQEGVRGAVALARQPVDEPGADGRRPGRPRPGDALSR